MEYYGPRIGWIQDFVNGGVEATIGAAGMMTLPRPAPPLLLTGMDKPC